MSIRSSLMSGAGYVMSAARHQRRRASLECRALRRACSPLLKQRRLECSPNGTMTFGYAVFARLALFLSCPSGDDRGLLGLARVARHSTHAPVTAALREWRPLDGARSQFVGPCSDVRCRPLIS